MKIEPIAEKINNKYYLSSFYQNIGSLYSKLSDCNKALHYFEKVLNINDTIQQLDIVSITLIHIGSCYLKLNKISEAQKYINQGIRYSIKSKNLAYEKYGYFKMYELYKATNNYKAALEYFEKYQKINEDIKSKEYENSLANFDAKYKSVQYQNKIITQQNTILNNEKHINKQKFWIILFLFFILLLTFIILILYGYQKNKQKQKELLYLKKIQDEKQRISKDLHDNLGAELTFVTMLIDSEAMQNKPNKEGLLDISNKVRHAISLMRDTIWATSGEQKTLYELGIRMKEFAEKLASPKNIKVNYSIKGEDVELNPDKILNLYRITQEIINNAVKHSHTKNTNIQITNDKQVSISISDEGVGFDVGSVKKNYGLNNIFSRASNINARVLYSSEVNKGTRYTIVL